MSRKGGPSRSDTCEARWKSHRESDLIFDRRMQCLRRSALSLDRALVMIGEAGPAHALQIADALPRAETCADPDTNADLSLTDSPEHEALQLRFDQAQLLPPLARSPMPSRSCACCWAP